MTELLFFGLLVGAFFLIAIIYITIGIYRQKKVERAYRKHQDLAKAKRENVEIIITTAINIDKIFFIFQSPFQMKFLLQFYFIP